MLGKYLTPSDTSPEVEAELIRAGAGHMPIVASGTLVAAGVIWFLLHDIVANEELVGWCAAIAVLMAVRFLSYRQFCKRIRDEQAVLRSARVFITLALV